jgi:DNA-directed RNA polymerase subunit RPC12/RpoP
MPFFGPQPLSNPIAVVTLLVVLIISCCLLSMNRYIAAAMNARREKKKKKARESITCPHCNSSEKLGTIFCTKCGERIL